VWSALYQQRPAPEEGDYFKADWLKPVDILPARETMNVYGASDYAVTSKGGDYTVHIVVGVDAEGRMYVLDLWRGQADSATWIEEWCNLVKQWKPREWAEEGGQINAAIGPFLQRRASERGAYTYRRQFPSRHDKSVRAQSIRGRMATMGLYVPRAASWRAEFASELLRFPAAKHDDQVDALGLIGNLLDDIRAPSKPKMADPKASRSGYHALIEEQKPPSVLLI
jgi:predicted phage terminase large subunit-like protein